LFVIHRVAAAAEEDPRVKECILKMGTRVEGKNELLPLSALRETMAQKPYCWIMFKRRVERNLRAWNEDTMSENPLLDVVYKDIVEEEEQQVPVSASIKQSPAAAGKAVGRLTRARSLLYAQGDDPLQDSMDLANEAMGGAAQALVRSTPPKSSSKKQKRANAAFYEKHKGATRLSFGDSQPPDDGVTDDDSDDDDDFKEGEGAAHLSTLPSPAKSGSGGRKRKNRFSPIRRSQQKTYSGRRRWTDEEKQAIKEGIRQLGAGKWAAIKILFSVILADRTSGQMKVRYDDTYICFGFALRG
jgi:hypothetical protein